jgi:hypothetical protein
VRAAQRQQSRWRPGRDRRPIRDRQQGSATMPLPEQDRYIMQRMRG